MLTFFLLFSVVSVEYSNGKGCSTVQSERRICSSWWIRESWRTITSSKSRFRSFVGLPLNVNYLLQILALDSQVIGDRRAYTSCATSFVRRIAARCVIMMDNTKLIILTVVCWCRSCRCGAGHHQATLSTISLKKVGGVASSHSSSCFFHPLLYFLIEKCNHQ